MAHSWPTYCNHTCGQNYVCQNAWNNWYNRHGVCQPFNCACYDLYLHHGYSSPVSMNTSTCCNVNSPRKTFSNICAFNNVPSKQHTPIPMDYNYSRNGKKESTNQRIVQDASTNTDTLESVKCPRCQLTMEGCPVFCGLSSPSYAASDSQILQHRKIELNNSPQHQQCVTDCPNTIVSIDLTSPCQSTSWVTLKPERRLQTNQIAVSDEENSNDSTNFQF